jgi:predicted nucleic acid-binding protein
VASEIKSFRLPEWVRVLAVPADLPQIAGIEAPGPGEAEAIRLALRLSPDRLLLDDGQGRRVAKALNLRVTGVPGLLVTARESGLIQSIRPEVDSLISKGFHVSDWLYDDLLADD